MKNLLARMLLFLLLFFSIFNLKKIQAINMESSKFKMESANVSTAAGSKSSDNYQLSDTVGQTVAGQFASSGYVIKAGFQYLKSIIPFRFTVSNTNVNLGTLIPNTFSTSQITLKVDFGSAGEYQVLAYEEYPMKNPTGITIPDTSCNGGSETCNKLLAKLWNSTSTYGFGYNMSGDDIPADFINSNYFRPFANKENGDNPVVIMSSSNVGRNRQSTLTFKANISSVQPAGSYQTVIHFIAIPSF